MGLLEQIHCFCSPFARPKRSPSTKCPLSPPPKEPRLKDASLGLATGSTAELVDAFEVAELVFFCAPAFVYCNCLAMLLLFNAPPFVVVFCLMFCAGLV